MLASPDPGLQPERTVLAWTRTLLSLIVCAVLFLRWLPTAGWPTLIPLAAALIGGGAIYLGRRRTSYRSVVAIQQERHDPPVGAILGVTGLVMVIAASAIIVL